MTDRSPATPTTPRTIEAVLGDVATTHAALRAAGRPHRRRLLELTVEVHLLKEAGDPVAAAWFRQNARRVMVSFAGGEANLEQLLAAAEGVATEESRPTRAEVDAALATFHEPADHPADETAA